MPDNGVYVYFRHQDRDTVMVALNKGDKVARLDLARFRESLVRGAHGRDVLTGAEVTLNDALEVPARGVALIEMR